MSDELRSRIRKWLLEAGKLCGALAAVGLVLGLLGGQVLGTVRGWVVSEANAQAQRVFKEDRDAQARVNRQLADAVDDLRGEIYEGRKDTRAMSAQIRQFTGIRSDRLEKPIPPPPPVVLDGGP